ncbi:MAG: hypothetical protein ABEK01_05525 [Candidatus Nanohaloarchaea archaeon]
MGGSIEKNVFIDTQTLNVKLYEAVKDLELKITEFDTRQKEKNVSKDFTRRTTVVEVSGNGHTGRGEDVIYENEKHIYPEMEIEGSYSFDGFSRSLEEKRLFPGEMEADETQRNYRRWAVESAVLDLALKQNGEDLGSVLGMDYSPVRFVASPGMDGKQIELLEEFTSREPGVEFKLDVSGSWDGEFVEKLREMDRVRVVDFKAHYEKDIGQPPADPELYSTVVSGLPDAILEDPMIDGNTEEVFRGEEDRVTWDEPVKGVESVRELPFTPEVLNMKPSRFGTVRSFLETVEYCRKKGIRMYGGGQFELGVGRKHIQAVASIFYPDSPNDVAPRVYNRSELPGELPSSPLELEPEDGIV